MSVHDLSQSDTADGPCTAGSLGAGGYEDIATGTQVSVYGGAGDLLALGNLAAGQLEMGQPQQVDDWSNAPEAPPVPDVEAPQSEWDAFNKATDEYLDATMNLPQKTVYWGWCTFPFTVDVPDSDFYSIEVAHRGKVNFSRQDLEAEGWVVALSVG
ncbi:hypothetical protein [Actinotalea ferrariae]|nr:hypothetical protein [Actinotalea ferrariae]